MLSPLSFFLVFPTQYDQYKTPMENIGLQDSLLSRFDLLFIMLDQMDPEHDREISDHVLRMHRYRAPGEQDGDGEAGGRGNLTEGRAPRHRPHSQTQPGVGGRGSIWGDVEGALASLVPTVCLLSISGSGNTFEPLLWARWFCLLICGAHVSASFWVLALRVLYLFRRSDFPWVQLFLILSPDLVFQLCL